jgi:hypothetical protein
MRFLCNGRVYVDAEMQLFRTDDASVPKIYLTRDGRATFVVNREPDGVLSAHRAGTGEIINLSRRHNIAGLLRAFPAAFAPAQILSTDSRDATDLAPGSANGQALAAGTESAGVLA